MNIFFLLAIAMLIIIIMLRKKIPIGPLYAGGKEVCLSGLFVFHNQFIYGRHLPKRSQCRVHMIFFFALYFVMCLEIELRTSGALAGMVHALQRIFPAPKVTLAVMPAFLGLLPSLGGARFSAPIVEEASAKLNITEDHKALLIFGFGIFLNFPVRLFLV